MALNISSHKIWVGSVLKVGGMLGLVGLETITGRIVRFDKLLSSVGIWDCYATPGIRLGVGLGGSAGYAIIIVLNTQFYIDLHGLDIGGPGLNIAFEERFGQIPLSKHQYKAFEALAKGVMTTKNSSGITAIVNTIVTGINYASSEPIAFMFDVPGLGVGLELSAVYTIKYKLQLQGL